jgi:hypothetical protein
MGGVWKQDDGALEEMEKREEKEHLNPDITGFLSIKALLEIHTTLVGSLIQPPPFLSNTQFNQFNDQTSFILVTSFSIATIFNIDPVSSLLLIVTIHH